jgi:uncharacterized protein YqiB (DUF1249 family)
MQFQGILLTGCEPRTLASLMELYGSNYRRLLRLAPELHEMSSSYLSRVAGALDLHLAVVERFKYTTTVVLTYGFPTDDGMLLEPNVQVRLYHDARLAEAVRDARRHRARTSRCRRRGPFTELERRWDQNRFLQRWLGYCQRQGHLFLLYNESPLESADVML